MRASFDYSDEKMRKIDEILFHYNKILPTSDRISKSELLRLLCDMVVDEKMTIDKLLKEVIKR